MPDEINKRRFLTIEQVAEELATSEVQIRVMLKTGQLRGIQIGGRNAWRISRQDLEDFIQDAYRQVSERIAAGNVEDEDGAS
ncbi:DNA binding domain-containing protein, excisionase family [Arthrobacter sp. yr096]|uniref:helix-turn-helix domain-containing protein n=1 Tax=unclassified Arthrobacter TaxID=235627 RepID=UPI00089AD0F3|nr:MULTISPECIES: helix-turn-helix domain-containing protein [unclassified Arthrobacter]SDX13173.1 DNA binding domain-containing protein, excisionase family [Arthrobacter sp. cf158]SEJ62358.1 DNA binding domain-containing protein, excisionase family [Arthrobacter sp. yr096]